MVGYHIDIKVENAVREIAKSYKIDLRDRLLDISVNIIRFLSSLPENREFDVFRYQLSKSATSIGANYEEAQASTYKEFVNRIRISLREAKETLYWMRILVKLNIGNGPDRDRLLKESDEISKIFGSILLKVLKSS